MFNVGAAARCDLLILIFTTDQKIAASFHSSAPTDALSNPVEAAARCDLLILIFTSGRGIR
jgi:hypothetical protein